MQQEEKLKYLKISLVVFGIIFIAGIYVMMMWVWPAGWAWTPRQPEYEQMIMGLYTTLGVFLVLAAKDPLANLSLIWFTIWSSIIHGGIMLVQAIVDETERAHLLGDVPALFLVGIVLWYLVPKKLMLSKKFLTRRCSGHGKATPLRFRNKADRATGLPYRLQETI